VREPSVRPESLLITDDEHRNVDDNSSLESLDELFLNRRGNAGSDANTNRSDTIPNSKDDDENLPSDDDVQSVHTVSSKLTNLSLGVRKRAVSGTAVTSSSKRVISRKQRAVLVASREGGYQTRSKDQQQ